MKIVRKLCRLARRSHSWAWNRYTAHVTVWSKWSASSHVQIDQLKQELSKKESELLALQTKLETLNNQNSDCKQHIEVLKESLTAKEQRAAILQTEVIKQAQLICTRTINLLNNTSLHKHSQAPSQTEQTIGSPWARGLLQQIISAVCLLWKLCSKWSAT